MEDRSPIRVTGEKAGAEKREEEEEEYHGAIRFFARMECPPMESTTEIVAHLESRLSVAFLGSVRFLRLIIEF